MTQVSSWQEAEALLTQGLLNLGLEASESQRASLMEYARLMLKWNRVYNLTAITSPKDVIVLHLLDALSILGPMLRARPQLSTVLDVGTGAGIPAVIIAIMCPQVNVTCVDAVQKKIAFIQQVVLALGLTNLFPLHTRVEALSSTHELICSRAFASLKDFTDLTRAFLAEGGVWMAMKAKLSTDEQAALSKDLNAFHVEHLQVPFLEAERCLVWIRPE
jgi:16S rRNA (guanine527-N7)-methyltransferase